MNSNKIKKSWIKKGSVSRPKPCPKSKIVTNIINHNFLKNILMPLKSMSNRNKKCLSTLLKIYLYNLDMCKLATLMDDPNIPSLMNCGMMEELQFYTMKNLNFDLFPSSQTASTTAQAFKITNLSIWRAKRFSKNLTEVYYKELPINNVSVDVANVHLKYKHIPVQVRDHEFIRKVYMPLLDIVDTVPLNLKNTIQLLLKNYVFSVELTKSAKEIDEAINCNKKVYERLSEMIVDPERNSFIIKTICPFMQSIPDGHFTIQQAKALNALIGSYVKADAQIMSQDIF